jgi:H+/Cl- antiporter ClcA
MRLGHLLSHRHWQARLLMWAAAGAVGAAAVAFAKIADVAQWGLKRVIGIAAWTPRVPAPVGFFVIAWLTRRYFRGAEGSGIPRRYSRRRDRARCGPIDARQAIPRPAPRAGARGRRHRRRSRIQPLRAF